MDLNINIRLSTKSTIIEQMAKHFGLPLERNSIQIPTQLGQGFVQFFALPHQIQVHHFKYRLNNPIELKSENHLEDGLFMFQINLSNGIVDKQIGGQEVALSQSGGCGVFFYSPGYGSYGKAELDTPFELLFFSFPRTTFLQFYPDTAPNPLKQLEKFCIYDELSRTMEQQVFKVLTQYPKAGNQFTVEGLLLQLLGQLMDQFAQRTTIPSTTLNRTDVERQLKVKAILLEHIYGNLPTIEEIAQMVHVSPTKVKSDFKSVFGNSIYQYYLEKKMDAAAELIQKNQLTISEIGHQLGYNNLSQFSAKFKKQFKYSPAAYRKKIFSSS